MKFILLYLLFYEKSVMSFMNNIISLYIDKYNIRDNESEEKRVRGLIKKLREEKSVFCDFPFDYLQEEQQLILLHYIMTLLPERQIMANMKKVDVDRCYMNFVYQSEKSKKVSEDILENYIPISLKNEYLKSRYEIRNPANNINAVLKYLLDINATIINLYMNEDTLFKVIGFKIYIKDYIDYIANVLLQLLVYRIINQDNIKALNIIEVLSEKVNELNELIEKQLIKKKTEWQQSKENGQNVLDAELVSKCFSSYITHRSKFYEEYKIKKILKDEMLSFPLLFKDVPKEYTAAKIIVSEDDKSIKNIITEGKHIDGYKEKIETVKVFIDIMADYGGRQCYSSCLQDLKVYFREIFISKSSYKKRMASRIVKEYINQFELAKKEGNNIPDFNKQSQYMFIREKISRGYFREKGLSKEYIEKIIFEKELYDLLLKIYLFYNVQDSLKFIYEVNYNLLKVYESEI